MDLEDVFFIGSCVLTSVLGYHSGKNAMRKEFEEEARDREILEMRREIQRLRAISDQSSET